MITSLANAGLIAVSWMMVFVMPVIRLFKAMQKEQDRIYWIMANEISKRGEKKS